MSERMNKEQAKNILKDFNEQIKDYGEDLMPEEKELSQALDIAIESLEREDKLLDQLDIAEPKWVREGSSLALSSYEWNDISFREPNDIQADYIVIDDDGYLHIAFYKEDKHRIKWYYSNGVPLDNIIAWKKIEPYKRKE